MRSVPMNNHPIFRLVRNLKYQTTCYVIYYFYGSIRAFVHMIIILFCFLCFQVQSFFSTFPDQYRVTGNVYIILNTTIVIKHVLYARCLTRFD